MNFKLHFLHSHLHNFPDNLGRFNEVQGERPHQDIKVMKACPIKDDGTKICKIYLDEKRTCYCSKVDKQYCKYSLL